MERKPMNNLEGLAKTLLIQLQTDHVLSQNGEQCNFKLIYQIIDRKHILLNVYCNSAYCNIPCSNINCELRKYIFST